MSVKFVSFEGKVQIFKSTYLWKKFLNSSGPLPYIHPEYGCGYIVKAF